MKMYESVQSVEKYLNVELECTCGMTHYAPIKAVEISSGALEKLPYYTKTYGYKKPYILCDPITYDIAGARCENLLKAEGIQPTTHIIKHLGYDEATLGEILINKSEDCDLMIGVGTGQITDILRYCSFKLKLPCFTVATAAPMDGFAAAVGIMNINNLKKTMPAHNTEIIIGDTDILENAPYRMTIAGYGDLIGKLNSLNDWRLGALVVGDHYCKSLDELVTENLYGIIDETELIKQRQPSALGDVMRTLILTGTVISLYGNSRPISGGEHHMSHFWEAIGDQRGKQFAMHGEQVAVATVLTLMLAKELVNLRPDFPAARGKAKEYDCSEWQNEIKRAYGTAADAIIDLETTAQKNAAAGRLLRIDVIEAHWNKIQELLQELRSPQWLYDTLKNLGCPCCPKDIGVDAALLRDTFLYCKETRACYTIFQLAWDLGVLEEATEHILAYLEMHGLV